MSKIKLSDSDKRLLVVFLAIIIVACSYFFIFTKSMSKSAEIEEQNDKDRATVQQMEAMEANLPNVRANIKTLKKREAAIIEKYPADLKTEKVIEILQSIEANCDDFHISNITFLMGSPMLSTDDTADGAAESGTSDTEASGTDTQVASTETADTQAADTQTADTQASNGGTTVGNNSNQVRGYYASIGIAYEVSYAGLKKMIQYVNEYPDRMTISDFQSAFDSETGKLSGNMTINMYYMMNTGKEYIPPEFEGVSKGVSNIFGGPAVEPGNEDNE